MKILYPIGTLYPSQAGGPSNTIFWLSKALVRQGVEVTLVTTAAGTGNLVAKDTWLSTDYGQVIYCDDHFHILPFKMIGQTVKLIPAHDCIHLNSLFYPPSLISAFVALWYRKSVIWSVRGNLETAAMKIRTWKKRPALWLIRQLFKNKNFTFHTTSENEVAQTKLLLGGSANIVEIPNYLELPARVKRQETKPRFLLFVGRIHPIKALDNLLQSLHLSRVFIESDFVLKIAGAGEQNYVTQLQTLARKLGLEKRVTFLGHIEGHAKQQLYADAHFLILPSHSENFGNVIIEALAQSTPVITSTYTPWEILPQQQAGFWVGNDPEKLSEAINQALALNGDEYIQMRENALSLVMSKFDIEKNIDNWMSVYYDTVTPLKV